jgi:hypothetical protein
MLDSPKKWGRKGASIKGPCHLNIGIGSLSLTNQDKNPEIIDNKGFLAKC